MGAGISTAVVVLLLVASFFMSLLAPYVLDKSSKSSSSKHRNKIHDIINAAQFNQQQQQQQQQQMYGSKRNCSGELSDCELSPRTLPMCRKSRFQMNNPGGITNYDEHSVTATVGLY